MSWPWTVASRKVGVMVDLLLCIKIPYYATA
jgi:hypothetical protein